MQELILNKDLTVSIHMSKVVEILEEHPFDQIKQDKIIRYTVLINNEKYIDLDILRTILFGEKQIIQEPTNRDEFLINILKNNPNMM